MEPFNKKNLLNAYEFLRLVKLTYFILDGNSFKNTIKVWF